MWQGLRHDLSKYTPTEFIPGVKFYTGHRSPNEGEREVFGYSKAWMHQMCIRDRISTVHKVFDNKDTYIEAMSKSSGTGGVEKIVGLIKDLSK